MHQPIRILILEDNSNDAEIVQRLLLKEKMDCTFYLATDKETYLAGLNEFLPQVVLSDHSLPQFNSYEALSLARKSAPDMPFIMVTGAVSEEFAAKITKAGADDYVLKDRLSRLPGAILAVLKKQHTEREKQEAKNKNIQYELNLRTIFENTSEGFILLDKNGIVKAMNSNALEYGLFEQGHPIKVGGLMLNFVEDSRKGFFKEIFTLVLNGENVQYEKFYDKAGNPTWIEFSVMPVKENGSVTGICYTGRDISNKKIIEQQREFERNNLAALINNTTDLMWSVDKDFKLITANIAFEEMSGALYGNPIKKGDSVFTGNHTEERKKLLKQCYERAFKGASFTEMLVTNERWGEISFYPIYVLDIIIGTACFYRDITKRQQREEQVKLMEQEMLKHKVQEQKKITRAIIKAQEKERNHLGEELHDNINQLLAGTKLYLSTAANQNPQYKELIKYPLEFIGNAIEEIRLLCGRLVTPTRDIDLQTLVNNLLNSYQIKKMVKTSFSYNLPNRLLSDELKLNIYRIVQEQVNNILKHAAAKNITVSIKEKEGALDILVADDGKGFDVKIIRKGIGISNMINRVESYNGKVIINSSAGNGSNIFITIPLCT